MYLIILLNQRTRLLKIQIRCKICFLICLLIRRIAPAQCEYLVLRLMLINCLLSPSFNILLLYNLGIVVSFKVVSPYAHFFSFIFCLKNFLTCIYLFEIVRSFAVWMMKWMRDLLSFIQIVYCFHNNIASLTYDLRVLFWSLGSMNLMFW